MVPGPQMSRALPYGGPKRQGPGFPRYRLEGTVHPRRPHSDTSGKSVVPKTTLKSYESTERCSELALRERSSWGRGVAQSSGCTTQEASLSTSGVSTVCPPGINLRSACTEHADGAPPSRVFTGALWPHHRARLTVQAAELILQPYLKSTDIDPKTPPRSARSLPGVPEAPGETKALLLGWISRGLESPSQKLRADLGWGKAEFSTPETCPGRLTQLLLQSPGCAVP